MKLLLACRLGVDPYLNVHAEGLRSAGVGFEADLDAFWNADPFPYDAVHVQWPENLFPGRVPAEWELDRLEGRLKQIASRAAVVYTRHNEVSHKADAQTAAVFKRLYDLLETGCDAMVHLGPPSRTACMQRPELKGKLHVEIPIPVFDEWCRPYLNVSREDARQRLGLPRHRRIVLAFGAIRTEAERRMLRGAFTARRGRDPLLVVPRWHPTGSYCFRWSDPLELVSSLAKAVDQYRHGLRLKMNRRYSEEEVALYFAASDAVLVPRIDDLNSANIPMAFLFRKVVLGADTGNIGYWIRHTGNPLFDPAEPGSILAAVQSALELAANGKGEENHRFAMANWATRKVGAAYADLYRSLPRKP